MKRLRIERVGSTNTYLKEHIGEIEPMTMVTAVEQTAGRGQRGNTWESEPGKNLTFSFYIQPDMLPAEQFAISEAVALAFVDLLAGCGVEARVKWPNDIYVGDKKICGILIENSIMGKSISQSVVGAGLNVNQTEFLSDAPNPVSMKNITGKEYELEEVADRLGEALENRLAMLGDKASLHSDYMGCLWRGDGRRHRFYDVREDRELEAEIESIELTGHLNLRHDGGISRYAFKEVIFL